MSNFHFLFGKAITEPLHAVILLILNKTDIGYRIIGLHYKTSAINSGESSIKGAVYIAEAEWERIRYSVLVWTRSRSRILDQNPLTDADSKFGDPHISGIDAVIGCDNYRNYRNLPKTYRKLNYRKWKPYPNPNRNPKPINLNPIKHLI